MKSVTRLATTIAIVLTLASPVATGAPGRTVSVDRATVRAKLAGRSVERLGTVGDEPRPGALGWGWARFAYAGWLRLSWLDENVLSRVVPDELFYNVCVTGTKPRGTSES